MGAQREKLTNWIRKDGRKFWGNSKVLGDS